MQGKGLVTLPFQSCSAGMQSTCNNVSALPVRGACNWQINASNGYSSTEEGLTSILLDTFTD